MVRRLGVQRIDRARHFGYTFESIVAALADDAAGSPLLDVDGYRWLAAYQAKQMDGVTYLSGVTSTYRKQRGA